MYVYTHFLYESVSLKIVILSAVLSIEGCLPVYGDFVHGGCCPWGMLSMRGCCPRDVCQRCGQGGYLWGFCLWGILSIGDVVHGRCFP